MGPSIGNYLVAWQDEGFGPSAGLTGEPHALPTSFLDCPQRVKVGPVTVAPPPCVDSNLDCDTPEEFSKFKAYVKDVDKSMVEPLRNVKKARLTFERRACDFRYSEVTNKSPTTSEAYGPHGPMVPGGSYLYELRRWGDQISKLYRTCSNHPACLNMIDYLREHPEDDMTTGGGHGRSGSKLYNELRMACSVGRSRAPVPNDSPVWCDTTTGLCERRSCRSWWREAHPDLDHPPPWVDDREDYSRLQAACGWIYNTKPDNSDVNKFQKQLDTNAVGLRDEFCEPRWVEGICSDKMKKKTHADCTLSNLWHCRHGLVLPGVDESDDTVNWQESFHEKPISTHKASLGPLPILLLASRCVAVGCEEEEAAAQERQGGRAEEQKEEEEEDAENATDIQRQDVQTTLQRASCGAKCGAEAGHDEASVAVDDAVAVAVPARVGASFVGAAAVVPASADADVGVDVQTFPANVQRRLRLRATSRCAEAVARSFL